MCGAGVVEATREKREPLLSKLLSKGRESKPRAMERVGG